MTLPTANAALTRRKGLQRLLALCGALSVAEQASAGGQKEEPLIDSVRTALSAAIANNAPPVPVFADTESRLEYLRWLGAMSERLKRKKPDWQTRKEFLQTVWYESKRAGLDVALVLGLIQVESAFRKFAISRVGARGYMQVMPFWTRVLGDGDRGQAVPHEYQPALWLRDLAPLPGYGARRPVHGAGPLQRLAWQAAVSQRGECRTQTLGIQRQALKRACGRDFRQPCLGRGRGAERLGQLAVLVHLHHDVRATNEFALHVELGNGRPVAVFLDALANTVIFQHVHCFYGLGIDTAGLQDLNGAARKTTLGKAGVALHEQKDFVGFHQFVNALMCVAHKSAFGVY